YHSTARHAGGYFTGVRTAICGGSDRSPRTFGPRSRRTSHPQPGGVAERYAVASNHALDVGPRVVVDHPHFPARDRYHSRKAVSERAAEFGVCVAKCGTTACHPAALVCDEPGHNRRSILEAGVCNRDVSTRSVELPTCPVCRPGCSVCGYLARGEPAVAGASRS